MAALERTYHELAEAAARFHETLTEHEQSLHASDRQVANFIQGGEGFDEEQLKRQRQATSSQHAEQKKQLEHLKLLLQKAARKMAIVRQAIDA